MVDIGCAVGIISNVLQHGWGHRRNVGACVVDHVVIALVVAAKLLGPVVPVRNQMSLRATRNREAHLSLRGCALDLLVALLGLLLFVALGVLGRADLASFGIDAGSCLSISLDDFAGRSLVVWHFDIRRLLDRFDSGLLGGGLCNGFDSGLFDTWHVYLFIRFSNG